MSGYMVSDMDYCRLVSKSADLCCLTSVPSGQLSDNVV